MLNLPVSPREISSPVKKRVWQDNSWRIYLGLILSLIGSGVTVVLYVFFTAPAEIRTLEKRGVLTTGEVTSIKANRNIRVNNRYPMQFYYVYKDSNNVSRTGMTETLDGNFIAYVKVGSLVPVLYDPDRPELSKIQGVPLVEIPTFVLLLVGSIAIFGILILLGGIAKIWRIIDILENGEVAEGTIVWDKAIWYVNFGNRHPLGIRYSYTDSFGCEHIISSWTALRDAHQILEKSEKITVLYSLANPKKSVIGELYFGVSSEEQERRE